MLAIRRDKFTSHEININTLSKKVIIMIICDFSDNLWTCSIESIDRLISFLADILIALLYFKLSFTLCKLSIFLINALVKREMEIITSKIIYLLFLINKILKMNRTFGITFIFDTTDTPAIKCRCLS